MAKAAKKGRKKAGKEPKKSNNKTFGQLITEWERLDAIRQAHYKQMENIEALEEDISKRVLGRGCDSKYVLYDGTIYHISSGFLGVEIEKVDPEEVK